MIKLPPREGKDLPRKRIGRPPSISENAVAIGLMNGFSIAQIAKSGHVSERTVRRHKRALAAKDHGGIADAVARAAQANMTADAVAAPTTALARVAIAVAAGTAPTPKELHEQARIVLADAMQHQDDRVRVVAATTVIRHVDPAVPDPLAPIEVTAQDGPSPLEQLMDVSRTAIAKKIAVPEDQE